MIGGLEKFALLPQHVGEVSVGVDERGPRIGQLQPRRGN
jgi:hypothetical protein